MKTHFKIKKEITRVLKDNTGRHSTQARLF